MINKSPTLLSAAIFENSDHLCSFANQRNLMLLKVAYLPSKLHFSGKYLFEENQISAGQLSAPIVSRQNCLNNQGCVNSSDKRSGREISFKSI